MSKSGEGEKLGVEAEAWERLYEAALSVRTRAWAPYSRFQVGAALLLGDGTIVSGCNVENATYGATVCAERTAVGNALCGGHRRFLALAVVTDLDSPAAPCGICRQVLAEFCDDLPILLGNLEGGRRWVQLGDLLPERFSGRELVDGDAP